MIEENTTQMRMTTDTASVMQNALQGEDEIDLGEYEIVRPEFFAHVKEPALTVNVDKIGVNAACVRLMPDVEYVQILVNRKEKKLLLKPCGLVLLGGKGLLHSLKLRVCRVELSALLLEVGHTVLAAAEGFLGVSRLVEPFGELLVLIGDCHKLRSLLFKVGDLPLQLGGVLLLGLRLFLR